MENILPVGAAPARPGGWGPWAVVSPAGEEGVVYLGDGLLCHLLRTLNATFSPLHWVWKRRERKCSSFLETRRSLCSIVSKKKKKSRAAKSSDHVLSRVRGRELELFFINGLWALESLGSLASL